jgi:hypothetical protein
MQRGIGRSPRNQVAVMLNYSFIESGLRIAILTLAVSFFGA